MRCDMIVFTGKLNQSSSSILCTLQFLLGHVLVNHEAASCSNPVVN